MDPVPDDLVSPAHLAGADGAADVVRSAAVVVAEHSGQTGAASASAVLPTVLADVPVAILLIDQDTGLVIFANHAATELAPGVRPPASVDMWGRAAGLTSVGGEALGVIGGPLSVIASGLPVAGEAIRVPTRDPDQGADRLLWATGFPLSRPESAAERLALLVLLEVTPPAGSADPEEAMRALRERALAATDLGFTISDPTRADNPLVWVNPAFTAMTGYAEDEAVGRNCRFLQGDGTDRAAVAQIAPALAERRSITTILLNYRRDGTAFWNELSLTPVVDGNGTLAAFVGVQADVTERVETDRDLLEAHLAERRARADAEAARRRHLLLAEATSLLSATLDVTEGIDRLVRLVVPLLADWAVVSLVGDDGQLHIEASRHRDGRVEGLAEYASLLDEVLNESSLQRRVQLTGRPLLVPSFENSPGEVTEKVMRVSRELGLKSAIVVPLIARRRVLGALALVSGSSGRTFTADDLDTAADLGRRAGLALDNARLYEREHRTAETLQAHMLPVLPPVAGLDVAVAYLAGDAAASVGGDFYELLELQDGSIAVAVGDVVGHDMTAAVQMGQLRSHFRGCLWEAAADGSPDPALVLQRLDRLVQGLGVAPMASLFHASLTRPAAGQADWTVAYSDAGHPHALLRTPEGDVTELDQADGILLGISGEDRRTATCRAPAGSQLVFFTDGLIERRGSDLDEGVRSLVTAIAELPVRASVEAVRDALVTHAGPDRSDDIAVLVVGLL